MTLLLMSGLGLLIVAIGVVLLTGRGSFLIAGFNTKPKAEKDKYDTKALCKFAGKIALPIGILTPFVGIESIMGWYVWVYTAAILIIAISAAIYANTGNRFRK